MTIDRPLTLCAVAGVLACLGAAMAQTPPAPRTQPPAPRHVAPEPKPAAPAAATPATPAQPAAAAETADVVARAGATSVSASEIRAYLDQLGGREQTAVSRDPRLLSQAVRSMLANQLVLKEALAKKWDQQPDIAAQLERIRQEAIVETYLRAQSAPPAGYPNDAELENTYEANKAAFVVSRQYRIAQIVVAVTQGAGKEAEDKARKKLEAIQKKLAASGADFAAVATAESDDNETAAKGGELGWVPENQVRPEIRAQLTGLSVNAVSDAVRLDDGWHLFKLIETKPASTRPLAEIREQLAQRMREERATAARRAYLGKLIEQSPPVINELALARLAGEQKAPPK